VSKDLVYGGMNAKELKKSVHDEKEKRKRFCNLNCHADSYVESIMAN